VQPRVLGADLAMPLFLSPTGMSIPPRLDGARRVSMPASDASRSAREPG
jgi:hypothetical protein